METQLFMVRCLGNFYGGKYYETKIDSIYVVATSPEEAVQIAQQNADAVVEHFHNKKYRVGSRTIRALRLKDNKVKISDDARPVPEQRSYHKALSANGQFGPVNLDESFKNMSFIEFLKEMEVDPNDPQARQKLAKAQAAAKSSSPNDDIRLRRDEINSENEKARNTTDPQEKQAAMKRAQMLKKKNARREPLGSEKNEEQM